MPTKINTKGEKTVDTTNKNQNRFKSAVVWGAVLGQLLLIIGLFLPEITEEVKIIGFAVIEILTLFGILNNPTNKTGF